MKKSLVIGASTNPQRYAYQCITMLRDHNIETVAIGLREGNVQDVKITTEKEKFEDIHTVNIYLSAKNLKEYEDYIIDLKPKRVLFPPGTENPEFENRLTKEKILHERACPLVMLSVSTY
ncbi:hypothetical protein C7377_1623 [Balneicella halophila]|uniref:CoA-binding domain-containing protein n=1 Tax=Balneicella halophila TaxID=1537566 RepID=A0A7L4UMX5_BALHA|nr:CoA-binding protein [Balneicella halophila]PVX49981.1 hypothetical protein C7377_1623 [Balneicella halophila]